MRFPRVIRLDNSDPQVFAQAAEPGEWAVTGSFAFLDQDPARLERKERLAFASGWFGTASGGRATLVEVAEITEAQFFQVVERLARHFVAHYGAPSLADALPAARAEADDAAALADHKLHSLLALERELGDQGLVERIRVVRPERAGDHAKIWRIVPDQEP
jgi:hypothetical protein